MGRRYQLTNLSHPRGESSSLFALLHTRHSSPLLSLSPKLERKRTVDHATVSPVLPHCFPLASALSLFSAPAFRHSDILRHNVEIGEPKVRFLFFLFPHSKRVAAAFSLPRARCLPSSLCCLPRIRGHASSPLLFFFLSTRFATSLTFVFRSFLSFSHQAPPAEPFHRRRPTLQQHPRPAPRREHRRHSSGRSLSVDGGIRAAVLKQALYDSKGPSPRSTRPLPSSRRRRSAPRRQVYRQASSVEHSPNSHPGTKCPLPSIQVCFRAGPVLPPSFSGEGIAKESFTLRTARPWFPRGGTAISRSKRRA